ncbi:hypothetical protein DL770_007749 [Monosporascus sp. CRB-9-2]|nr:hypothetical protein DL770_007749 [Monosporascus sp. CRB-9-2]
MRLFRVTLDVLPLVVVVDVLLGAPLPAPTTWTTLSGIPEQPAEARDGGGCRKAVEPSYLAGECRPVIAVSVLLPEGGGLIANFLVKAELARLFESREGVAESDPHILPDAHVLQLTILAGDGIRLLAGFLIRGADDIILLQDGTAADAPHATGRGSCWRQPNSLRAIREMPDGR